MSHWDININKKGIKAYFKLHIENQSEMSYGKIARILTKGRWDIY